MGNCSDQFPKTEEYYANLSDDVLIIVLLAVACVLCIPTLLIYVEELCYLYRKYKKESVKCMKLFTLLGLYPMISVMSVFSILVPTSTVVCELVTSCYLSVCIYIFVTMVIDYFGGAGQMIDKLAEDKFRLNTPPICCCLCCIRPQTMTSKALHYLKLCTLQVALVKPFLLFIQTVLWTDGKYDQGEINPDSAALYITIATVISTLTSLYGLIVIYRATKAKLAHKKIGIKFFSLKLAILTVNIQTVIFGIMARYDVPPCLGKMGSKVRGTIIRHAVLTVEAFLLALLARHAYRNGEDETNVSYTLDTDVHTDCDMDSPDTQRSRNSDKYSVDYTGFEESNGRIFNRSDDNVRESNSHKAETNSGTIANGAVSESESREQVNVQYS